MLDSEIVERMICIYSGFCLLNPEFLQNVNFAIDFR